MDNETERDQLRHGLDAIDAIRAGRDWTRKPAPTDPLVASRLAILDTVAPPVDKLTAAPYLRVIQGGKAGNRNRPGWLPFGSSQPPPGYQSGRFDPP